MSAEREARLALVEKFGVNSSSFVALYEGYRYFELPGREGMLPYLETPHAWIGAGDPVAPRELWPELLRGFQTTAHSRGKVPMLLPCGAALRAIAREQGFGGLKIGAEPVFHLPDYQPALDTVTTARRLSDRGARVSEFSPARLSTEEKRDLDGMVEEWLASRKIDPLGFLNRVEPWSLSARKKYFRTVWNGRVLAFVAAVPIPARHGWYLIDIFRRRDSPPGSTEMLILEAARLLKAEGAQVVTLGMAPLADLDLAPEPKRARLTRFMHFGYRYGGVTYNFRSLHQFKLKFQPTASEPCYLLFHPDRLGRTNIQGLIEATVGSPRRALGSALRKRLQHLDWLGALETRLARDFVLRPTPRHWTEIFKRAPFTLAVFCLLAGFYALTNEESTRHFTFTWSALEQGELRALVGSHLLHGGLGHLAANLLLLVLGVGTLEYFRGTSFTFSIYALCALLSNPLTAGAFLPARWLAPEFWETVRTTTDLGASLGIFGCVGSLVTILKQQRWVLSVLGVFYVGYSVYSGNVLALSHITALLLGAAIEIIW